MNVVVVCPSGASASEVEQLGDRSIRFVTWSEATFAEEADHIQILRLHKPTPGTFALKVADALNKSAPGRNLLRLTRWDDGRAFARIAKKDPAFAKAMANADVVAAAERDAIYTVWHLGRTQAPASAHLVYGVAGVRSLISSTD